MDAAITYKLEFINVIIWLLAQRNTVIVETFVTIITLNPSNGFLVRHGSNVANNSCTRILWVFFTSPEVAMDNKVYTLNNLNLRDTTKQQAVEIIDTEIKIMQYKIQCLKQITIFYLKYIYILIFNKKYIYIFIYIKCIF